MFIVSSDNIIDEDIIDKNRFINNDMKSRRFITLVSYIIIIFIPVYAKIETTIINDKVVEITYMWPWLVIKYLTTPSIFQSQQVAVTGFPWIFIIYIPFFYALKFIYNLYNDNTNRVRVLSNAFISVIIQLAIIMIYFARDPTVIETRKIIYTPFYILIPLYLYFIAIWYLEESQAALQVSKLKKLKNEKE